MLTALEPTRADSIETATGSKQINSPCFHNHTPTNTAQSSKTSNERKTVFRPSVEIRDTSLAKLLEQFSKNSHVTPNITKIEVNNRDPSTQLGMYRDQGQFTPVSIYCNVKWNYSQNTTQSENSEKGKELAQLVINQHTDGSVTVQYWRQISTPMFNSASLRAGLFS